MNLFQGLYPQIRFKNGKKRIWNPVYKKTVVALPEEVVRHRFMEWLINKAGWPVSRISMESGVHMQKGFGRTDLICYRRNFAPFLLVECKAPTVLINEKTALQAVQYNQQVKAEFVCLCNGTTTLFFKANDPATFLAASDIFPELNSVSQTDYPYWLKRGFLADDVSPENAITLNMCHTFFYEQPYPVSYLRPPIVYEHGLNHFYSVLPIAKTEFVAWSFMAADPKKTELVLLFSRKGELESALILPYQATSSALSAIKITPDGTSEIQVTSGVFTEPDTRQFPIHIKELSTYR